MIKKRVGVLVVLVLLSSFSVAAESCSGFFGTLSCVLWGDPAVRSSLAGEAVRGNLVGGATDD